MDGRLRIESSGLGFLRRDYPPMDCVGFMQSQCGVQSETSMYGSHMPSIHSTDFCLWVFLKSKVTEFSASTYLYLDIV